MKIIADQPEAIRALAADENIDRAFVLRPPANTFFLWRLLRNLSYEGTHFPHMTARNDPDRIARHETLWQAFNEQAGRMAQGPDELEPLAKWIRAESGEEAGILVQDLIGRFFLPDFKASPESWQAALALREDATSKNILKMIGWQVTGKANKAKALLGKLTNQNIVAMHGIAVAAHNLVATLHELKAAYAVGNRMTPEAAVLHTLSAPPVVYRQALAAGAAAGCPYSKFTLFLLKLKDANAAGKAPDLVFMSGTWSRCPAEQWIPAVIAGTWKRAISGT